MVGLFLAFGAWAGMDCEFPDLDSMVPVPLEPGAGEAKGDGGDIPGGRWELVRLRYALSLPFITLAGDGRGALELDAVDSSSGMGALALEVTITSPSEEEINEAGAGPYSAAGNMLTFQNDCGDELLLGDVEYDINTDGDAPLMTLWGSSSFDITDPFPTTVTVLLQAEFELAEPQAGGDPIFEDRFEQP